MQDIKLFIASSAEMDEDKQQFDIFFNEKNKLYKKKYISFDHKTWKDFPSSIAKDTLQSRYDEYIKTCDIVIFLFHTKLGQYTMQELRVAYEQFIGSNGKKPLIYIYVKDSEGDILFLNKLKSVSEYDYGHFCDTYVDYKELLMKFDKQLQLLENEKFLKPNPIDVPKLLRNTLFVCLPLLILILGFYAYTFFTPQIFTLKLTENTHSKLPFYGAEVSLQYADKTETMQLNDWDDELIFKEIHTRYFGDDIKIKVLARGYNTIDTVVKLDKYMELLVHRDQSSGVIFGDVKNENGVPIANATVRINSVNSINVLTNQQGYFKLSIPIDQQRVEQRVIVYKKGYKQWEFTAPASEVTPWKIILQKSF